MHFILFLISDKIKTIGNFKNPILSFVTHSLPSKYNFHMMFCLEDFKYLSWLQLWKAGVKGIMVEGKEERYKKKWNQ